MTIRLVTAPPGPLREIVQPFDYHASGAIDFGALTPGNSIIQAQLVIDVAFDDPATLISLGQVSDPDGILSTNDVQPLVVSTYAAQENVLVTIADALRLKIFPFASTRGAGRVVALIG